MAESIYDVFQSIASLGMQVTLYLKTDGKLIEKRGSIRNITSTGVLIQNSSEISFISSQSIETFTVTREGDNNQQLNSRGDDEKSPTDNYQDRLPADADPKLDNNIFGIFFEQFELPSPQPDFNVSGLTTDDRTDVVRWKNRYDYAIKINEKVRLLDDIRSIGRLAERLRHAELYFLAGALAILGGKHELAQPQLMNGLALGSMRAGTALTWLAWQDNDFSKAAEMACRAVTLDPNAFGGNEASIIILGRILAKLPDPAIPWLLDALAQFAGSPSETTTNPLIGFALRMLSPAAAEAALAGDLDGAKRLFPEAKLFQPLAKLLITADKSEIAIPIPPRTTTPIEEFGRVTAVFADRGFGFLINEVTGETFYFNLVHVTDPILLDDLESDVIGHKVYFVAQPGVKSVRFKYDHARSIRLRPNQDVASHRHAIQPRGRAPSSKTSRDGNRAPLPARLAVLPKGAGPYADAKRQEQMDNLDAAEDLFRKAIEGGGNYRQSAIKDLAMLLSRKNRPSEAISLLDHHRDEFDPKRPVDNIKAFMLIKLAKYRDAAELFVSLYKSAPIGTKDSITSARQAGYCFSMISDFRNALKYLEEVDRVSRGDAITIKLIEKVRAAHAAGTISSDVARQLQELAGIAAASGLSPFATYFIQMSDYIKGADERSITRGFFDNRDFQRIDRQMRAVRGRQPRMKGQLLQTLAAMCVKAPLEAGELSVHDILRTCFLFMGEAALNDKLAVDSVRCFLAEAAHLAMRTDQVTDVARYLLSTYLSEPLSAEELTDMGAASQSPSNT